MVRIIIIVILSIATFFFGLKYFSVGQLDRELVGSRQRIEQLTIEYNEIARNNESLRIRLGSVIGGVRSANSLIEEISREGRNAQETLRITIENLKKVKAIIAGIADL